MELKSKVTNKDMAVILFSLIFLYCIALVIENESVSNTLSPLISAISSFFIYKNFKSKKHNRDSWKMLLIAGVVWTMNDVLWGYYITYKNLSPSDWTFFGCFYLIPGVMIMIAQALYLKNKIRKIEKPIVIVDLSIITILLASIFLSKTYHGNAYFIIDSFSDLLTALYVLVDFTILGITSLLYLSQKRLGKDYYISAVSVGAVIYAVTDIILQYQWINNLYTTNTVLDGGYIFSLAVIAVGGIFVSLEHEKKIECVCVDNQKPDKSWILLSPVIIYSLLKEQNSLMSFTIIVLIILHRTTSSHIKSELSKRKVLEDAVEKKTAALKEINSKLRYLAERDSLMGLYNRASFIEKLESMINQRIDDEIIAVMFIDLDRFKYINDSYGHDVGDLVLQEIAIRFSENMPSDYVLARLGGDEFVIAIPRFPDDRYLESFSENLIDICREPIEIDHYSFNISMSIGISTTKESPADRGILMKNADIAMYAAKASPDVKYLIYNRELAGKQERENKIRSLLGNISFDDEFQVHYQPQFEANTKELVGVEALVRWFSPELGFVSPGEFIPIAEDSNLIIAIGDWVLNESISQVSFWNRQYNRNLRVGVNISPKQITSRDFLKNISSIVSRYSIESNLVDIELTERVAMDNNEDTKNIIKKLSSHGFLLSIDDFGTGYSSLGYIKEYDADKLKIAKELIDNIATSETDVQIAKAIVLMAKALNIKTIAEGVEDESQLEVLRSIGCDEIQGYIWGRPVSSDDFEKEYLEYAYQGLNEMIIDFT